LLSGPFFEEVIVPLAIGSLNFKAVPLFTVKFALFILGKMVTVMKNLGLLNKYGELLFGTTPLYFSDWQLSTAGLSLFNLKKLLN